MNPLDWDVPWVVLYFSLAGIVFVRSNVFHLIGRGVTTGMAHSARIRKYIERPGFAKAQNLVARYGAPIITLCFATVGLQTLVLVSAGITKMPWRRYLPANILGCLLWALIYSTVGFVGFKLIAWAFNGYPLAASGCAVLIVAAIASYVWFSRKKASEVLEATQQQTVEAHA